MQAQYSNDQWHRLAVTIAKLKGAYLGSRLSPAAIAILDADADATLARYLAE